MDNAIDRRMAVAFLDRDGVINKDVGYAHRVNDFEFIDGVIDALTLLQRHGYALMIMTNQSGIGRGYYTEQQYQQLTRWYCDRLSEASIDVKDVFHCPHAPDDGCGCRKPLAGLFSQAAKKYSIDFSRSLMVGDKLSDMQAGHRAGVRWNYLLAPEQHLSSLSTDRYCVADNLLACVKQHLAIKKDQENGRNR